MSVPVLLEKLVGRWRGFNRLHTTWIPENPVRETPSAAMVDSVRPPEIGVGVLAAPPFVPLPNAPKPDADDLVRPGKPPGRH